METNLIKILNRYISQIDEELSKISEDIESYQESSETLDSYLLHINDIKFSDLNSVITFHTPEYDENIKMIQFFIERGLLKEYSEQSQVANLIRIIQEALSINIEKRASIISELNSKSYYLSEEKNKYVSLLNIISNYNDETYINEETFAIMKKLISEIEPTNELVNFLIKVIHNNEKNKGKKETAPQVEELVKEPKPEEPKEISEELIAAAIKEKEEIADQESYNKARDAFIEKVNAAKKLIYKEDEFGKVDQSVSLLINTLDIFIDEIKDSSDLTVEDFEFWPDNVKVEADIPKNSTSSNIALLTASLFINEINDLYSMEGVSKDDEEFILNGLKDIAYRCLHSEFKNISNSTINLKRYLQAFPETEDLYILLSDNFDTLYEIIKDNQPIKYNIDQFMNCDLSDEEQIEFVKQNLEKVGIPLNDFIKDRARKLYGYLINYLSSDTINNLGFDDDTKTDNMSVSIRNVVEELCSTCDYIRSLEEPELIPETIGDSQTELETSIDGATTVFSNYIVFLDGEGLLEKLQSANYSGSYRLINTAVNKLKVLATGGRCGSQHIPPIDKKYIADGKEKKNGNIYSLQYTHNGYDAARITYKVIPDFKYVPPGSSTPRFMLLIVDIYDGSIDSEKDGMQKSLPMYEAEAKFVDSHKNNVTYVETVAQKSAKDGVISSELQEYIDQGKDVFKRLQNFKPGKKKSNQGKKKKKDEK